MLDRQELLKSFNDSQEKLFFAKVLDQIELCIKKHTNTCTDFLDPAKIQLYDSKLKTIKDIEYKFFGGYEEAERKMIGFYQDYSDMKETDFPIVAIKIEVNNKFCKSLNHRHYLGSVLGTGIERSKLGDIIVIDNYAIAFIDKNISEYICTNLTKVSNAKVEISIIGLDNLPLPQKNYKVIKTTVASLRLDAIIGAAFHLSRSKANEFINSEKVNLNWVCVKSSSTILKQGDIFALRGYGRAKLSEITGKTRKDRIGVLIYIYV